MAANKDQEYLGKLQDYYARHKALPSMAAAGQLLGLSSTASVFGVVARLKSAGFLTQTPDRRLAPTKQFFARPLLGPVRAGEPEPVDSDDFPAALNIDDYLVDAPTRTVLLKVKGASMKDAGILEGDLVVVERNAATSPGDIVVAVVDGEYTVKYLAKDRKGFFLRAANEAFTDIRPARRLEIFGLVTGQLRRYGR